MDVRSWDWSSPDFKQISLVCAPRLVQNMSTVLCTTVIQELPTQEQNVLHFHEKAINIKAIVNNLW
jgi:hypothetical protein